MTLIYKMTIDYLVIQYANESAKIDEKYNRFILNNNILTKEQRIDALAALGAYLSTLSAKTTPFFQTVATKNPWYTADNVQRQLNATSENLDKQKLEEWTAEYEANDSDKVVALVLAGNIPLVGFHDILSALILGFRVQIKPSSDDAGLTKFVLDELVSFEQRFADHITFVERLGDYDIIIATGSNNSARYFEYYFGQKPHIIRKNRNAIAVLTGKESANELYALGGDIFAFFGLGCRSISKIYVPNDYNFTSFFETIEPYKQVQDHFKYNNNYDYNKSIFLINGDRHLDNGFLLVKEDDKLASPLGTVHFTYYNNITDVAREIDGQRDNIQCITTHAHIDTAVPIFPFGQSQSPGLTDYADNINTLDFLSKHQ